MAVKANLEKGDLRMVGWKFVEYISPQEHIKKIHLNVKHIKKIHLNVKLLLLNIKWRITESFFYNQGYKETSTQDQLEGRRWEQIGIWLANRGHSNECGYQRYPLGSTVLEPHIGNRIPEGWNWEINFPLFDRSRISVLIR